MWTSGANGLHLGAQLLGGAMALGIEQGPQQQHPGAGDPAAALPEQGQGALDRVDAGRCRVGLGELLVTGPSYAADSMGEQDAVASWSHSF